MTVRRIAMLPAAVFVLLAAAAGADSPPVMAVAPIEISAEERHAERAGELAGELRNVLLEEIARHGYDVSADGAVSLHASPYLIFTDDRIGFGVNIYDADSHFLVTGDLAVASSERALLPAVRRSTEVVATGAHRYLERVAIEQEQRVERLVFSAPQPDVALYLPDESLLGTTDSGGRLEVQDTRFRRGQHLALRLERRGHYSREHSSELTAREEHIDLPRLPMRTRLSVGARHVPALPLGGGLAARYYPVADQFFLEVAGAMMRLDGDRWLAEDLTFAKGLDEGEFEDRDDFEESGGESAEFTMIDAVVSLGTYLFVSPGRFLRPGLQSGVGVWNARSGDWSHGTLYIAPVNPFLSIGNRRLRGRVVGGIRYTLDSEHGPFGRRVYAGTDRFAYLWLEVGYTW